MGGDLVLGGEDAPLPPDPDGTDMVGATERLAARRGAAARDLHARLRHDELRRRRRLRDGEHALDAARDGRARAGPRRAARSSRSSTPATSSSCDELIGDGLIDGPPLIQLCTGIPYGAPDDPATLLAMVNRLPPDAVFSAFSIGRMQLPFVALAPLLGGNVRVGLEDNLYLSRGRLATNAELVDRAVSILEAMNVHVLRPAEVREKLALRARG